MTYTPATSFTGTASINYTVNDNEGATSNAATITITVNAAPNVAPVANNDNTTTTANTAVTINVVTNDTDSDGAIDATTVDLNTTQGGIQNSRTTTEGNYAVNSSGVVTYTPATSFTGTAAINYTVNDNAGATSNAATITITVDTTPNVAPVANNDNTTTTENTAVTINVVTNDTDSDGAIDATTVDLNTTQGGIQNSRTTTEGNYAVNSSGVVTYTPATSFTGTASINYTVNDNAGATSNAATITITVDTTPNVAPVANNDNTTTTANTAVTINVVTNDTDSDGAIDATTVDLNTTQGGIQNSRTTTEGDYSVNSSGVVTYTPATSFTGTASINYTVNDNAGATSNAATITITVDTTPNVAPVANNDNTTTTANTAVTINVVTNDTDSDGAIDATTVDLNTTQGGIQNSRTTTEGDYSVNSSGVVTYTPATSFTGTASINYTVNDNAGATSNAATITITVDTTPNVAPVANNDNTTTTANTAVTINVVTNDTDSDGTIDATTVDLNTTQGGIQNSRTTTEGNYAVNSSGVVTYTPATSFTGTAAINYTVNDNAGATSNAATITITVDTTPNVAPVANNDNTTTTANTAVTINVVTNDTDSDGAIDATTVDLNTTQGGIQNSRTTTEGDYAVNSSGVVTYTPATSFTGTAAINYTVNDNAGATSNAATITITVDTTPNVAPVANNDNTTTTENTAVTINVVTNDTDSDGAIDATTVDLNTTQGGIQNSSTTTEGNYSVNSSGVVTYTPATSFTGTASINYTVNDNAGATSNAATITITVDTTPNVAPVANNDNTTTTANTAVTINVVTNDTDSDGAIDATTVDLNTTQGGIQNSSTTTEGDYSVNSSGVVTYTPATSFTGTASINYTVNDNAGATSNAASITIEVTGESVSGLDIPNAFTPNGDGANETWKILPNNEGESSQFQDVEIRVFSKRGVLVFEGKGLNSQWDGTHHGKVLPADSYFYTINSKASKVRFKGVVTILR